MKPRTNFIYLLHFLAVLEHRNFTKAAASLNVAQPSVTRSIKMLEQQLGHALFERTTRHVIPTAVGLQFARTARLVVGELNSGISNIQALAPKHASSIRIDGSPIVAPRLFPKAIADMSAKHPEHGVLVNGPFDMQFEKKRQSLSRGELDLIASIASRDHDEDNIVRLSLLRPELRIAIARDHPLRQSAATNIVELRDALWILPKKGSEPCNVVENEFKVAGAPIPSRAYHMENWDVALSFVRYAKAICALPFHPACFGELDQDIVLLPMRFRVDPISIDIYVRSTFQESPPLVAFVDVLKDIVREAEQADPAWNKA